MIALNPHSNMGKNLSFLPKPIVSELYEWSKLLRRQWLTILLLLYVVHYDVVHTVFVCKMPKTIPQIQKQIRVVSGSPICCALHAGTITSMNHFEHCTSLG